MRVTLIGLLALLLTACDVGFEPHVTPVIWATPPTAAAPQEVPDLSADSAGLRELIFYQQVYCGAEAKCYELCVDGECGIYDANHPRVQSFIAAVNDYESDKKDAEDAAKKDAVFSIGTVVACAGFAASLLSPEPFSKVVMVALGAGATCGVGILQTNFAQDDKSEAQSDMRQAELWARGEFEVLRMEP